MQNFMREQEWKLRGFKYLKWKIKKVGFRKDLETVLPMQISEFLPMKVSNRGYSPKEETNWWSSSGDSIFFLLLCKCHSTLLACWGKFSLTKLF